MSKRKHTKQTLAKDVQASDQRRRNNNQLAKDVQPTETLTYNSKVFRIYLVLREEQCKKIRDVSEVCTTDCKVAPVIRFLIDLGYEEYKRKLKAEGKDSLTKAMYGSEKEICWEKHLRDSKPKEDK